MKSALMGDSLYFRVMKPTFPSEFYMDSYLILTSPEDILKNTTRYLEFVSNQMIKRCLIMATPVNTTSDQELEKFNINIVSKVSESANTLNKNLMFYMYFNMEVRNALCATSECLET